MTDTPPKKSDLGVRTLSAVVVLAVAGTALWLGGAVWIAFAGAVAAGVLWEWRALAIALTASPVRRILWLSAGVAYIGVASAMLMYLRHLSVLHVLLPMAGVIATDIGAYFAGRGIGGPKIAPAISPSKTWAGLAGGIFGASLVVYAFSGGYRLSAINPLIESIVLGALIAIIAQTGDFFESWMKRRAGVKDSGTIIPGHGGLLDRVDGLLAVCFVIGLPMLASQVVR